MLLDELANPSVEHSPVLDQVDEAGKTVGDARHSGDGQQKHKRALEAKLVAARAAKAQPAFFGWRTASGKRARNRWGGQPGGQRSCVRQDHYRGRLCE